MTEIKISVDDRLFQQRTSEIAEALGPSHLQRVLGDIGENLVEEIKQRIEDNRKWGGGQFAPNSAVTLKRKRGAKPLIDSGVFASSRLYYSLSSGAASVTVGASAVQSAVLQFGAKKGAFGKTKRGAPIPWGDIPARPYMPITDAGQLEPEAHELVLEVIEEYLDSLTDKPGKS